MCYGVAKHDGLAMSELLTVWVSRKVGVLYKNFKSPKGVLLWFIVNLRSISFELWKMQTLTQSTHKSAEELLVPFLT